MGFDVDQQSTGDRAFHTDTKTRVLYILITVGAFTAGIVDRIAPVEQSHALLVESAFTTTGFAIILYSLYVDRAEPPPPPMGEDVREFAFGRVAHSIA